MYLNPHMFTATSLEVVNSFPCNYQQISNVCIFIHKQHIIYFIGCSGKETRISGLSVEHISSASVINISPIRCNNLNATT